MTKATHVLVNEIARTSYGRLLAIIAAKTGDMASAEDFLAHAFEQALKRWPSRGIPPNPEAWLITTAKNKLLDNIKSAANRYRVDEETDMSLLSIVETLDTDQISDKRLAMIFACAHPAIDARIRTPLILQSIFGFEAVFIANIFAIPAAIMAQRLVRAKKKIKLARIPFVLPEKSDMPERLEAVLEAIYGAYAIGLNQAQEARDDLSNEALYLSDILVRMLPEHAEVYGLAALLSYSIGCADNQPEYTPLDERNPECWNVAFLERADRLLVKAQRMKQLGQFQLEAAIFSVHANRRNTGRVDDTALLVLYNGLLTINPTLGAMAARAAVLSKINGAVAGLQALELMSERAASFQPYWATKAKLLRENGDSEASIIAAQKTISLTSDRRVRQYLESEYLSKI